MIVLALEEFASRRRSAQERIEQALHPIVARALDGNVNTDGYQELLGEVRDQWRIAYQDEAGTIRGHLPGQFTDDIITTLRKTDRAKSDHNTVDRITVWLATAILSHATITASDDDPEELFLEWVDMNDDKVRHTHHEASGQQRPIGEDFTVGGQKMPYPGYPGVDIELWINCRCTVRPVLADEVLAAAVRMRLAGCSWTQVAERHGLLTPVGMSQMLMEMQAKVLGLMSEEPTVFNLEKFKDYSPEQREKVPTQPGTDGAYPIADCEDLKNAIQSIGRSKDPAKTKTWIRSRKSALGCPDVSLPDTWDLMWHPKFGTEEEHMPENETDDTQVEAPEVVDLDPPVTPGYGVLTVEDTWSGDKRRFSPGAVRSRPLPLPLSWQRSSDDGHKKSVTVFKIDRQERVGNEIRYSGNFIVNAESDEVQALIAEFGRFGVSVDADNVDMEFSEEGAEQEGVTFTNARSCGGSIVQIPAFHEAFIALGQAPDDFFDGGEPLDSGGESMVASITEFVDVAPGRTEDGPGWLTHPVDTDRLRDYWVRGEGAAKINWGVPGDFNRCRAALAEYVKPNYLSGYCANRHYDALGFWPGQEASVADSLETTDPAEALSLVAATYGNIKAPAAWFHMEEPDNPDGVPLTITEDGQVYGHVAAWNQCHGNTAAYGTCRTAPKSPTNYSQFLLGETLTDEGPVATGCLTIGGGHAAGNLRLREAARHYDDATSVFADVTCVDGKHGIWVCGWVRPGTPEEMVVAARASKLSGDWRKTPKGFEMIAALAVNAPGFQIPRVAAGIVDGEQISLVAANVVVHDTTPVPEHFDVEALAEAVVARIAAREQAKVDMAALRSRFEQKVEAV